MADDKTPKTPMGPDDLPPPPLDPPIIMPPDDPQTVARWDRLRPAYIEALEAHISAAEGHAVHLEHNTTRIGAGSRRPTYRVTTTEGQDYIVALERNGVEISEQAHELQRWIYEQFRDNPYESPVARLVGPIGEFPTTHVKFQVTDFVSGKTSEGHTRGEQGPPPKKAPPPDPDGPTPPTPPPQPKLAFTPEEAAAYGRSLAKIHQLSQRYFEREGIEPHHQTTSAKIASSMQRDAKRAQEHAIREQWHSGTTPPPAVMKASLGLFTQAEAIRERNLQTGLAHRDPHNDNVIIRDDGRAIMVDLEGTGRGVPLQDAATAIHWCSRYKDSDEHFQFSPDHARAFLAGYDSVLPLSADDRSVIMELARIEIQRTIALSQIRGTAAPHSDDQQAKMREWERRVTAPGGTPGDHGV